MDTALLMAARAADQSREDAAVLIQFVWRRHIRRQERRLVEKAEQMFVVFFLLHLQSRATPPQCASLREPAASLAASAPSKSQGSQRILKQEADGG